MFLQLNLREIAAILKRENPLRVSESGFSWEGPKLQPELILQAVHARTYASVKEAFQI